MLTGRWMPLLQSIIGIRRTAATSKTRREAHFWPLGPLQKRHAVHQRNAAEMADKVSFTLDSCYFSSNTRTSEDRILIASTQPDGPTDKTRKMAITTRNTVPVSRHITYGDVAEKPIPAAPSTRWMVSPSPTRKMLLVTVLKFCCGPSASSALHTPSL